MANEIAIPGLQLQQREDANDATFSMIAKGGEWLARFQLFTSSSEAVKSGKIAMAHFGIVPNKDTIIDVGAEVNVAVLAWRARAIRLLGDSILSYYTVTDPEFAKIQAESEIKDSGCMFGPEFLLWVPSNESFASYHMNNKTAHREAPKLKALLGKFATIKSDYIKTEKYSWHGPKIFPCTTPLAPMPDVDKMNAEVQKFNNPSTSKIETVQSDGGEERAR